jgi:hypothetical protein
MPFESVKRIPGFEIAKDPRESLLKQTTISLLIILAVAQAGLPQATFHGNIARTGAYDSPALKQLTGIKWKFKTEGHIFSSPAIADGVVFIGSADTYLYAVDQQTGQQKWKALNTRRICPS